VNVSGKGSEAGLPTRLIPQDEIPNGSIAMTPFPFFIARLLSCGGIKKGRRATGDAR